MYKSIRLARRADSPAVTVAIALWEGAKSLPAEYSALDRTLGGALAAAISRPEFSAAKGSLTTVFSRSAGKASIERAFIVGLGDRGKYNGESLRIGGGKLVRAAFAAKLRRVDINLVPGLGSSAAGAAGLKGNDEISSAGRAFADGLSISNFEFDAFKGNGKPDDKKGAAAPQDLIVGIEPAMAATVERWLRVGESVNVARSIAATPPNVAHPRYLVDRAKAMAKETGLKCTIIDAAHAKRLGMGGLLAVGAAGSTPPALIVLEWKGGKSSDKRGPLMFVGKAVTFDTGGYSIKPAENMDKMKYDKCGGMAVLGAMHAIARLKLPVHVIGLVPAAENMISQDAYRPGDIVKFCNGVTAEITNTDAEGRLILADALAYGTRTYKPSAVVDLATLTGGVVVALGSAMAGCFCSDTDLRKRLFEAADDTGERLWHLPLWDEHRAQIKGTHGDIVNSAGREAHPIQGAAFLSFFIEPDGAKSMPKLPWAHLDIAGVADVKSEKPPFATGPTGFGVRLLVRAAERWGK